MIRVLTVYLIHTGEQISSMILSAWSYLNAFQAS